MEFIRSLIDLFLHLDKHLNTIMQGYGAWTYAILFLIVFCETGLVITPFLPGDSLLFAAGALTATSGSPLNITVLIVLLIIAAIVGDTVNYWIGHYIGPKVFAKEQVRFLNKEHLERTHRFYEKYGGKTIIIARFIPIMRTFAPFVAGMARMNYVQFISYNIVGGVLWIILFTMAGYFFGGRPEVEENFGLVIIAIIAISILPAVIEFIRHRRSLRNVTPVSE